MANSLKTLYKLYTPDLIRGCLCSIPFLSGEDVDIQENVIVGNLQADVKVTVRFPAGQKILICQVGVYGQPRYARSAVNNLDRLTAEIPGSYGIFIAPYISRKSADICTSNQIGYIDRSGNCRIAFGYVYIERTGLPNIHSEDRVLLSLFSPKSERVLRVLFDDTNKLWGTNKLAYEAEVSVGQSSNVRRLLRDNEYIEESPGGFKLCDPERLLMEWQKKYDFKKHEITEHYSFDDPQEIEVKVAEVCRECNFEYAFTGFSGAARYAPHVRYQKASIYVADHSVSAKIGRNLGLKRVGSGGKIEMVIPYEDGVFQNSEEIDGLTVASPIQVYLDLKCLAGRGDEAADFLLKEVIEPRW
jgi:hypothetical protein